MNNTETPTTTYRIRESKKADRDGCTWIVVEVGKASMYRVEVWTWSRESAEAIRAALIEGRSFRHGAVLLMTLKEAAEYLGVTPDNLRGAIHRGSLKATKQGRDWFVTRGEVERYDREHLADRSPRRAEDESRPDGTRYAVH